MDKTKMDMKSLLKKLVETESPSHDREAVNHVGALVAAEANRLGAQTEIISNQQTGNHVLARFPSNHPSTFNLQLATFQPSNPILLLCHMDTVFPLGALAKMPFHEADGKIFGPGTLDMKSGIVICLAAIEELQNTDGLKQPVTLLCTSDEEIGSHTSHELIEKLGKESAAVFVFEPALVDGSLKTWRKGGGGYKVTVKGRAAHAGGDHEKGRNAIEEMAHQIIAIQKLTDYTKQTTLNVGVIHGGTVSNVVPDEAIIEVDVRIMQPGEWERIEVEMNKLKPVLNGTSLHISGQLNRPPMPFDETMSATFAKAQSIAAGIGMDLKAGGTGGASDGNFIAPLGIPLLDGMGAIGEGYHSEREFIFADSLEQKKNLLVALLKNW
ncbi:MAG: M20 family metallopeptidase [Chloroflexota bacterium]